MVCERKIHNKCEAVKKHKCVCVYEVKKESRQKKYNGMCKRFGGMSKADIIREMNSSTWNVC